MDFGRGSATQWTRHQFDSEVVLQRVGLPRPGLEGEHLPTGPLQHQVRIPRLLYAIGSSSNRGGRAGRDRMKIGNTVYVAEESVIFDRQRRNRDPSRRFRNDRERLRKDPRIERRVELCRTGVGCANLGPAATPYASFVVCAIVSWGCARRTRVLQASDAATRPARAMAQNLVGMGRW